MTSADEKRNVPCPGCHVPLETPPEFDNHGYCNRCPGWFDLALWGPRTGWDMGKRDGRTCHHPHCDASHTPDEWYILPSYLPEVLKHEIETSGQCWPTDQLVAAQKPLAAAIALISDELARRGEQ